jgi:hypothetical protein
MVRSQKLKRSAGAPVTFRVSNPDPLSSQPPTRVPRWSASENVVPVALANLAALLLRLGTCPKDDEDAKLAGSSVWSCERYSTLAQCGSPSPAAPRGKGVERGTKPASVA